MHLPPPYTEIYSTFLLHLIDIFCQMLIYLSQNNYKIPLKRRHDFTSPGRNLQNASLNLLDYLTKESDFTRLSGYRSNK